MGELLHSMAKNITIIIPTLNERDNVERLIELLSCTLSDRNDWEVVFVDDNSTDGTLDKLQELSRQFTFCRYIRRIGRKGLATACTEGMLSSSAQFFVVMDADMQHDHTKIPAMLRLMEAGHAQLVIGTRYAQGGGLGSWSKGRASISAVATKLAHLFLAYPISDPMSGFFATTRDVMDKVYEKLSGRGFKILFDIMAHYGPGLLVAEVPYVFQERKAGATKLTPLICLDFIFMILDKMIGKYIYIDYLIYVCVGLFGALVHFSFLFLLHKSLQADFMLSQWIATILALTCNYIGNNYITFLPNSLQGRTLFYGWLKYAFACLGGILINVAVANYLFSAGMAWWAAGLAGAFLGSFSNFFLSKFFIWRG